MRGRWNILTVLLAGASLARRRVARNADYACADLGLRRSETIHFGLIRLQLDSH